MDRTALSEAIIQELGDLFRAELRAAGPEILRADLDGIEARLQAVSRRVCGATLERVLAVRAAPQGERPPCPACGGLLRLVAPAVALRVLDRAIQAHGGAGVSDDVFLAQAWAHTRALRLADGPDEVHRAAIAKMELRKQEPPGGVSRG